MSTVHINANNDDISNIVIMPGDPLRAKFIAETYLKEYKQINSTRNMLGYTGYYKDKKITVMASGMGNPSMGIYSYELYKNYNVDIIIRIGTCGSYKANINLYDVILVTDSYSNSSYGKNLEYNNDIISSSNEINKVIEEVANKRNINIINGVIHNTDTFYSTKIEDAINRNCIGVEMETFALFINAKILNKKAAAILTVSDNLVTKQEISSIEREKSTIEMILLALESAINL